MKRLLIIFFLGLALQISAQTPIFNWDARTGSYMDKVSGTFGTPTDVSFVETEKGLAGSFNPTTSEVQYSLSDLGNELHFNMWVKAIKPASGQSNFFYFNNGLRFCFDGSLVFVFYGIDVSTAVSGASMINDQWCTIDLYLLEDAYGLTLRLWLNGIFVKEVTDDDGSMGSYTTMDICRYINGNVSKFTIYNSALTQSQINDLYADFVNSTNLTETKTGFHYPKPTDLSNETGLVAAYNFIPQGTTLTDISGNGKIGTIVGGATQTVNGLAFDGVNDYVNCGTITGLNSNGPKSINIRAKYDNITTTQVLFSNVAGAVPAGIYISIASGQITVYQNDNGNYYTANTQIIIGEYFNFTFVYEDGLLEIYLNGELKASDNVPTSYPHLVGTLYLGKRGDVSSDHSKCEIQDLRIYNRALSESEVKAYHNSFADNVTYRNTFEYEGVGNVPYGWTPGTGTYSIAEYPKRNVENSIVNGGGEGATDWVDSNTDGLADGFSITGSGTASIVTGNGFTGNAQRLDVTATQNTFLSVTPSSVIDVPYEITLKVRSNNGIGIYYGGIQYPTVPANIGDATLVIISGGATLVTPLRIYARSTGGNSQSGDWFEIDIVNVKEIQQLEVGTKYVQCTSAGTISFQSNQAYGTWEFDINKGADANTTDVLFIQSAIGVSGVGQSYAFSILSTERALFKINTGSLLYSNTGYVTNNEWYSVKIIRTISGLFTIYFDNELVVAAFGTNPITENTYTISNYVVLDFDSGDRIKNFKFTEGIEQ